jgi:hypothetical protein
MAVSHAHMRLTTPGTALNSELTDLSSLLLGIFPQNIEGDQLENLADGRRILRLKARRMTAASRRTSVAVTDINIENPVIRISGSVARFLAGRLEHFREVF